MKKNVLLWMGLIFILNSGCSTLGTSPKSSSSQPSVFSLSRESALTRSKQVHHISYELEFDLTHGKEQFTGSSVIRFDLKPKAKDTQKNLLIDFEGGSISQLTINHQPVAADRIETYFDGHHLDIPLAELKASDNEIEVHFSHPYSHEGQGLHRFTDPEDQNVYLFSDFEPYHAHLMFPCFDQPDLKAQYNLQVKAPQSWQVISNTLQLQVQKNGDHQVWKFKKTPAISTYVFALHAGPYATWSRDASGIPLRLFARKSLAKYVDHSEWLTITEQGLDYFSIQFGMPYPFQKYDQIIVPEFNAGAMENVAAVTFSENFIYRTAVTENRRRSRADTILHEMAHMWFGDLVTMKWWNGLWLNESFASYMSTKAVDSATDFKGAWPAFFTGMKQWAYWEDQLITSHPIEVPIPSTEHADSIFDGITYGKGAATLKQLNYYIGDDDFREGLQRYFLKYAYKNTSINDFFEIQQEASGLDLMRWQKLWLQTPGVNTLRAQWSCEQDPETEESIIKDFSLLQGGSPQTPLRPHRTTVGLYYLSSNKKKHHPTSPILEPKISLDTHYSEASHYVDEAKGKPCPDLVFPNLNDHDYVKVELDPISIKTVLNSIDQITDPLTRQMIWQSLWEMVIDGQLSAADLAQTLLKYIPKEKDTLILSNQLRRLSDPSIRAPSLLKYIPEPDSLLFRAEIEKLALHEFKAAAPGSDHQLIWFQTFLNNSAQEESIRYLLDLLHGKIKLSKFKIDTERRWRILEALARQGVAGIEELIEKELKADPTDMGQKAAISAEVQIPRQEIKEKWIKELSQFPNPNYSFAKLRVASSQFRVLNQPTSIYPSEDLFFSTLEKLLEIKTVESDQYAAMFARGLYPATCDQKTTEKTARFLRKHSSLSPLVAKTLKVYQQEEERCIRARALVQQKKNKT